MNGFKIPLDFSNGTVYKNSIYTAKDELNDEQKLRHSIVNFIKLLLSSPNGSFIPDYSFGFSLNNFKFENVDNPTNSSDTINDKKIKDYSIDLEKTILKNLITRLKDIRATTEINKEKTEVTITLKAKYLDNREFKETFTSYIWKEK